MVAGYGYGTVIALVMGIVMFDGGLWLVIVIVMVMVGWSVGLGGYSVGSEGLYW